MTHNKPHDNAQRASVLHNESRIAYISMYTPDSIFIKLVPVVCRVIEDEKHSGNVPDDIIRQQATADLLENLNAVCSIITANGANYYQTRQCDVNAEQIMQLIERTNDFHDGSDLFEYIRRYVDAGYRVGSIIEMFTTRASKFEDMFGQKTIELKNVGKRVILDVK